MDMRGLANFIQDIRKATSNRDEEQKRIDIELSKIRSKFRETGKLTAYDRKKYVCKLMFIAMLGYTVDFGHMEGVQLLSGESSSEKLIGYLSLSVFLNENHELLTLTTHTVHLDLLSGKEFNTCLALTAIGNAGGKDFAEAMSHGVEKLILARVSANVKKKALLAMLRLYRKYKDVVDLPKVIPAAIELITDANMGVANCAVTFIQGVLESSTEIEGLLTQVPSNCIAVLERIIMHKATEVDYIYYSVPAPWLQTKILRLLQYFPRPEHHLFDRSIKILEKIQSATDRVLADAQTHQRQRGTQNRCNAMSAVLVEVVSLAILWDCRSLLDPCQKVLKTFVRDRKEANFRYLGLSLTTRLSFGQNMEARFNGHLEELQQDIFLALEDPDISIRKRALELLYSACTQQSAKEIINKFLEYIPQSEPAFRDDLVLVIAVLAEKFCTDNGWYCETILNLLQHAGDAVPRDVWYRLVHVVVGSPTIQKSMTEAAYSAMQGKYAPEVIVNVAAFLLGEFGYTIAVNAGSEPMAQVGALYTKMTAASPDTRSIILSTLCKLYNLYAVPNVRDKIVRIFELHKGSTHPEIQQRATEYLMLVTTLSDETLQLVLEPLPPFERESTVMQRLLERHQGTDRDVWAEKIRVRDERQARVSKALRDAGPSAAAVPTGAPSAQADAAPPKATARSAAEVEKVLNQMPTSSTSESAADMEMIHSYFIPLARSANKGPLYQGRDDVRIALTQEYRGADGRVTITIENISKSAIHNLSVTVTTTPSHLVLQHKPVEPTIAPGATSTILFACRCLGGFAGYPAIALSWEGRHDALRLKLPIGVQKFISPYDVKSPSDFEAMWSNTTAGNSSLSEVPQSLSLRGTAADLSATLNGLGFWSLAVDGKHTIAAASFASMPSQCVYQPVLVRISSAPDGVSTVLVKSPATELQNCVLALLDRS